MLTPQLALDCLTALKVLATEMDSTDHLILEEDLIEDMIQLKGHMTRRVEEFMQREALEMGLIFIRADAGYALIRPIWRVAHGYSDSSNVVNGSFHHVI